MIYATAAQIMLQLVSDESKHADMGHTGNQDSEHRCAAQLQLQLGLRRAEGNNNNKPSSLASLA